MTLTTLCALVPPLCRMAADEQVRRALADLDGAPLNEQTLAPLLQAMQQHPQDAQTTLSLLSPDPHGRCFDREALAFFQLCAQCSAAELLEVLTRCTLAPTADALAQLIGERRRKQAMARYALQLLWRLNGDDALPDALTVFPEPGQTARSAQDAAENVLRRLKGGTHD